LPILLIGGVVATAAAGCRGAGETTDQMVPPGWRGSAWGPEANEARLRGELPVIPFNPDMNTWDAWARQNLRDGDILFRMGDARAACGLFPFSRVSAAIADSRYSHSGIVAFEDGAPVVYDTTTTGPQRQPFAIWVLDTRGHLAVKRPRAPYDQSAAQAVEFCRAVYKAQVPFDYDMRLGDEKFYCIELTERAYRNAGLPLSQPVRLDHLPRYDEFPWMVRLMKLGSKMVPQQLAYVIGNDTIGIWSSPSLELVYEAPHARPPLGSTPTMIASQPPPGSTDVVR
jgi:hypothetical protein